MGYGPIMRVVAVIPARGGSKRLPGKNILPVLGNPMLFYPVQAALESALFDQVIVSTEDPDIGLAALQAGARVMDRPAALAGDGTGVADVCRQVLETLADEGVRPVRFCCVYATAVFITPEDLRASLQIMERFPETDVVMGVSRFNLNPSQALIVSSDGRLMPQWPDDCVRQSQGHPRRVASNGTLYWADTRYFLKSRTFYADILRGWEIPRLRAPDLNTPEDYEEVLTLAPLFLKNG